MRFLSPEDGYAGKPWYIANCCQVDAVDMVCTFAFPYVSWTAEVKLEGYIKTTSKVQWERIFEHEGRALAHDHDQEAVTQALLHAPQDLL